MKTSVKRVPAICTDIDGVLYRGSTKIDGSSATLRRILKPASGEVKLPFTCLTNGGGLLEDMKAKELNKKLDLEESTGYLTKDEVIQCHTVFADDKIRDQYQD